MMQVKQEVSPIQVVEGDRREMIIVCAGIGPHTTSLIGDRFC